jgi:hypothetical protein
MAPPLPPAPSAEIRYQPEAGIVYVVVLAKRSATPFLARIEASADSTNVTGMLKQSP